MYVFIWIYIVHVFSVIKFYFYIRINDDIKEMIIITTVFCLIYAMVVVWFILWLECMLWNEHTSKESILHQYQRNNHKNFKASRNISLHLKKPDKKMKSWRWGGGIIIIYLFIFALYIGIFTSLCVHSFAILTKYANSSRKVSAWS